MPGVWGEQEAIAAGLYDAPGSDAAKALKAATDKLRTGMSDLYGGGGNSQAGTFTVTQGAGSGGSTKVEPTKSKSLLPSLSDVWQGMQNGPGGSDISGQILGAPFSASFGKGLETTIQNWIVRIIVVVLGFIFVAAGLSLFGVDTRVGQTVVRTARDAIPK